MELISPIIKNTKMSDVKTKDLTNTKIGKLTVLKIYHKRNKNNRIMWECMCECGKQCIILGDLLNKSLRGKTGTKSCGCLRNNAHNKIKDREIAMWRQVYNSTIIKRTKKYKNSNDIGFEKFIDMSKSPCYYCGLVGSNLFTDRLDKSIQFNFNGIDRLDSNGSYTINNSVTCCKHCNCAKNTMSEKEFINFINRVYNHLLKKSQI